LTWKLLKKNPEYYTIWNHRRLILLHHLDAPAESTTASLKASTQDAIVNDLHFTVPLLISYPKCYWIWNYRRWLLEEAERRLDNAIARRLWEEELGLVGKMLTRDERNFHGWSYRRFVVSKLEALRTDEEGSLVEQEFAYTDKMIKAKLQNFSALHYRSKLLPSMLHERKADRKARKDILQQELSNMQEALIDPFNQSAWFYHQFLMSSLGDDLPKEQRIAQDLSTAEQVEIYEQEIERIQEIEEDVDDCKWVYEALIRYTLAYSTIEGSQPIDHDELLSWLQKLYQLDPMRKGRWDELAAKLKSI
jgi:geranylgeranyl transferase type-2 subunit alpha